MMRHPAKRLAACLRLSVVLLRELALSSWAVARAAVGPTQSISPAIIAMPVRLRTDLGIATLANLVSLTPGTTSLHVSPGRDVLYIHCLDGSDPHAVIAGIQHAFEDTLLEIES